MILVAVFKIELLESGGWSFVRKYFIVYWRVSEGFRISGVES